MAAATLALAQYADEQFVNLTSKLESTDVAEHERLITAEAAHLESLSGNVHKGRLDRKKVYDLKLKTKLLHLTHFEL